MIHRYLSTLSMARLTVLALVCFSILCLSSAGGKKGCKKPKRIRPVFLKESNCECVSEITGRMKQQDGKIFFCDGSEWKALAFEKAKLLGSKENPGSSCGDIKSNEPKQNTNGVYWINSTSKIFLYLLSRAFLFSHFFRRCYFLCWHVNDAMVNQRTTVVKGWHKYSSI